MTLSRVTVSRGVRVGAALLAHEDGRLPRGTQRQTCSALAQMSFSPRTPGSASRVGLRAGGVMSISGLIHHVARQCMTATGVAVAPSTECSLAPTCRSQHSATTVPVRLRHAVRKRSPRGCGAMPHYHVVEKQSPCDCGAGAELPRGRDAIAP